MMSTDGSGPNPIVQPQGILFDSVGVPLRFETPGFGVSNNSPICDPDCITFRRDNLLLLDNDSFDQAFLSDGTILTNTALTIPPGTPFTRLGGNWQFSDNEIGISIGNNLYQISPADVQDMPREGVPTPGTLVLVCAGLLGVAKAFRLSDQAAR
jgi:hypothetical protein